MEGSREERSIEECICGDTPLYCSYKCAKFAEGLEDIKQVMYSLEDKERIRIADMIMEMDYFALKAIAREVIQEHEQGGS